MHKLVVVVSWLLLTIPAGADDIVLWHSYRGSEEQALKQVVDAYNLRQDETRVKMLAVPHSAYAAKLTTAVPRGNGPDVFIFAHERIGGWAESNTIAKIELATEGFLPQTVAPLRYKGSLYGLPLAFKSTALFYNKKLVGTPPQTTEELLTECARQAAAGRVGLTYLYAKFYFHSAWYFGFGADLYDANEDIGFGAEASLRSLRFARRLQQIAAMPKDPTSVMVTRLFNEGQAAMVIDGPWFVGEIGDNIDYGIVPLPIVSETGQRAAPFLTTEAVFVSAVTKKRSASIEFAQYLAGAESASVRARVGGQLVANKQAWLDAAVRDNPEKKAFLAQLGAVVPMDNSPRMQNVWEPGDLMLKKMMLRSGYTAEEAAAAGMRRYRAIARPAPSAAQPTPYIIFVTVLLLVAVLWVTRAVWRIWREGVARASRSGWLWIAPSMAATVLLLMVPFAIGIVLSLFFHRNGDWTFVGLANFTDILSAKYYAPTEPMSFYFALVVTLFWTVANVMLHVGIGLFLAVLLNRPNLRFRGVYRVLFVVPWAVPSYITALVWKGLFDNQYGAINAILTGLGLEQVDWFSSFGTSFFANLCANVWLGFPFMMVVCLGALQAVPRDLIEAARVDGANAWQRFRHVTLPLLKPALLPAILIGSVWTFNQFNIVYLVSGGEPDNATDILISEAYRWAFARQEQFGYASAYAVIIFVILLGWGLYSMRVNKKLEEDA